MAMLTGGDSNTYLQGEGNGGTDKELRGKGAETREELVTATCGSKSTAECDRTPQHLGTGGLQQLSVQ